MQRIRSWSAAVLSTAVAVAGCGGVSPQDAATSEGSLSLSDEQERQQEPFTTLVPETVFPDVTGAEIESVCPGNPNPNCSGNMRLEIVTGVDSSEDVTVNVPNSIDYRLTKLLEYLDDNHPHQGWSRFLKGGKPNWSRIAVGGHSQGAGHAALIAQLRRVPRVVMLSGPPDSRMPNQSPPVVDSWVHIGRTPASRHFALYHHRDRFVTGPPTGTTGIPTNLSALGLDRFGQAVAVGTEGPYCTTDDLGPPSDSSFGQTRLLVTDLFPRGVGGCAGVGPGNPHRSTARDDFTPLAADGTPRLLGAGRYLLSASEEEDGQEEEAHDEGCHACVMVMSTTETLRRRKGRGF